MVFLYDSVYVWSRCSIRYVMCVWPFGGFSPDGCDYIPYWDTHAPFCVSEDMIFPSSLVYHQTLIIDTKICLFFFSHRKLKETSRGKNEQITFQWPLLYSHTIKVSISVSLQSENRSNLWRISNSPSHISTCTRFKRDGERERKRDMGMWTLGTETEGRKWNAEYRQC